MGLLCSIPDIPPHKVQKLHLGLLSDAQNDVLWLESQAWDAWESAKGLLLPLSAGAGGRAALVAVVFVVVLQQGGISNPQRFPASVWHRLCHRCVVWLGHSCVEHAFIISTASLQVLRMLPDNP